MTTSNDQLAQALSATASEDQTSPIKLAATNANAQSPNAAENPEKNSPSNTPIASSGNGNVAQTAIFKSNQTVSHACDSSTYVGAGVYQVGAFAGQVIQGIRTAVKAALEALGVSPSSSSLSNKLKKLAQYVSDITKFIKKITTYVQQFIAYVNALKQLLSYILSLPAVLLKYFVDCISTLKKQLVAGYQSAFTESGTSPTDAEVSDLNSSISSVTSSIQQFTAATTALAATSTAAAISLTVPTTIQSGNTQAQAAATTAVFTSAGFANASAQFGGKP
jgi:hypothetical protein